MSVNLLELRHSGGFVQQVDEVCVAEVLALVVGGGGCGEKQRRGACRHGEEPNKVYYYEGFLRKKWCKQINNVSISTLIFFFTR